MYTPRTRIKPPVKREFSKVVFIWTLILSMSVAAFSCVMMWRTLDISPLSYLIPSIFVELATATGFYYEKAKQENLQKYLKERGDNYDR